MKPMSDITVSTLCFIDDGTIPNNPTLPVLTYHHVLGSHEHLEKPLHLINGAILGLVVYFRIIIITVTRMKHF